MKICLIHDLGEAINGDIPAPQQVGMAPKADMEERDLKKVLDPLPATLKNEFLSLWHEYENVSSEEARLAKALDKLETIIQHNQGQNPDDFDYQFNLSYGAQFTAYAEPISLLRQIIDADTKAKSA